MLDCSEVTRFSSDDPALLEFLDEHGYAVVKGAASAADLPRLRNLLWEFLEANTAAADPNGRGPQGCGWVRGDPSTWSDAGMARVGSMVGVGILNGRGVGHSDFLWAVRELPNVVQAFATVWGTADLVSSFDGANVFRPYAWPPASTEVSAAVGMASSSSPPSARTKGGWWHVDQGPGKCGARHAVQGLLSLFDQGEATGGLCVVPGSHTRHAELCALAMAGSSSGRDFVPIPALLEGFNAMPRRLVPCKAGDLVLWDSRTFHCNTPAPRPLPWPPEPAPLSRRAAASGGAPAEKEPVGLEGAVELLRAVAYVCMGPAVLCDAEARRRRRAAYGAGVTTSHWPHDNLPECEQSEATVRRGAHKIPRDLSSASPLRRQLVG